MTTVTTWLARFVLRRIEQVDRLVLRAMKLRLESYNIKTKKWKE